MVKGCFFEMVLWDMSPTGYQSQVIKGCPVGGSPPSQGTGCMHKLPAGNVEQGRGRALRQCLPSESLERITISFRCVFNQKPQEAAGKIK